MEEKIFIKNAKGLKLAAIFNKPTGDGKFPAVILLGGFIEYKEHPRIEALVRELEKFGIGAIKFDPSGYGESEGTIETDYRFSNYISDTQKIFDYLTQLDWVDRNRIGVCGESIGGIQALILNKNNSQIKALAVISSPTQMGSSGDLRRKYAGWKEKGYLDRVSSRYGNIRIPFDFIKDASQYNALDYVPFVKQPILVIYGTTDVNVPNEATKKIYNMAPGKKELWIMEGVDHFLNRDPQVIEKVAKKVSDFFNAEL